MSLGVRASKKDPTEYGFPMGDAALRPASAPSTRFAWLLANFELRDLNVQRRKMNETQPFMGFFRFWFGQ